MDCKNEEFWNDLPNPKNNPEKLNFNNPQIEFVAKQCVESVMDEIYQNNEDVVTSKNRYMSEKYFKIWKNFVDSKKEQKRHEELVKRQREKLDTFIKKLKKHKKKKDIHIQVNQTKHESNFKNRFDAQKTIIEMQKSQLEEQNKVIQELKLGILSDDIEKSMEKAKINIRELFANCSKQIRYKAPLILGEPHFSINSKGAPKIVQKMEKRALERAQNREIILERKRMIEETRQKMVEHVIESKRTLEEEEKKRSLELIKEKRMKELEMEKIRQKNKHIFMEKWTKAVQFYNNLLIKTCIQKLYNNMQKSREKYFLAIQHYQNGLLRNCINNWINLVENTYEIKYNIADAQFEYKTLKKCLLKWRNARLESVRNMQVAEDFYDFRLTSNIFIHWNRYACIQYMKEQKNIKKAQDHHKRWLLFHYFYQWKSLKTVLQLERAKELKKERWRQKVWEILPDYQPPNDDL